MKSPSGIIEDLQKMIASMLCSVEESISPVNMRNHQPTDFRRGAQQDSYEYLGYLLTQMLQDETRMGLERTVPLDLDGDEIDGTRTRTVVDKFFRGRMSMNCKCLNCGEISANLEEFFDLQLALPSSSDESTSVQALVDRATATEQLIGNDQYFCNLCEKFCDGERKITLEDAPQNLIILIKHFECRNSLERPQKLFRNIHYDHDIAFTAIDGSRARYKLYACVIHHGKTANSGHYYTYASNNSNVWFRMNDSEVNRWHSKGIDDPDTSNTPYILFYEKNPWISSVDNEVAVTILVVSFVFSNLMMIHYSEEM